MKLRSDGFLHRRAMPTRYAFGRHRFFPRELPADQRFELSDNRSPHLAWDDVPEGTQSLVLLCHDPDAPADATDVNRPDRVVPRDATRADFVHWVLVDVPPTVRQLEEGAFSEGVTPRGKGPDSPVGRQGLNDYCGWFADDPDMSGEYFGYDGPCPPWNDELIHWYVFELFALDVPRLPVEKPTAADVRAAMEGHVLDTARLEGFYYIYPEARFR